MLRTREEIAQQYGCSTRTLDKFLKKIGVEKRCRITPGDFEALKRLLGTPTKERNEPPTSSPYNFL